MKDNLDVVVLDTETTGLHAGIDELLQVSILDGRGEILYNKYIKPDYCSRWDEAERIHHISPADVADAPHIADEMATICAILRRAKTIVGYNVGFDLAFLEHAGFVPDMEQKVFDVMFAFAEIYGEYNEYYGNYRWQKLSTCAAYYGYAWTENEQHNSLEDCRATLFCYRQMMRQKGDIS